MAFFHYDKKKQIHARERDPMYIDKELVIKTMQDNQHHHFILFCLLLTNKSSTGIDHSPDFSCSLSIELKAGGVKQHFSFGLAFL